MASHYSNLQEKETATLLPQFGNKTCYLSETCRAMCE